MKVTKAFLLACVATMLFRYQFLFNDNNQFSTLIKYSYYGLLVSIFGLAGILIIKELWSIAYKRNRGLAIFLVLWLVSYLPALATADFGHRSLYGNFLYYCSLFLVIPFISSGRRRLDFKETIILINRVIIVFSVFAAVFSLGIYFTETKKIYDDFTQIGYRGRLWGFTGNSNKDAILAFFSIFCSAINIALKAPSRNIKVLFSLNLVLQIGINALSGSRGGLGLLAIGALLPGAIIAFYISRKWFLRLLLAAVIVLGGKYYFGGTLGESILPKRLFSKEILHSKGRFEIWSKCSPLLEDRPFGVGFQNTSEECEKLNPKMRVSGISAGMHNVFAQSFIGGGYIVGAFSLGFYFWCLIVIFRSIYHSIRSSGTQSALFLSSFGLLGLLLHSLVENSLFFSANLPNTMFWIYFSFYLYLKQDGAGLEKTS